MNEREKTIRLWFDMWLNQQDMGIDDIFTEDVIYTESWSPQYNNRKTVKHWFQEWNTRGKVVIWEIKQFFHKGDQTIVEWYFKNEMNNGSIEEFDGISLVEWTEDNKIKALKEFGCNRNTYNPYKKAIPLNSKQKKRIGFELSAYGGKNMMYRTELVEGITVENVIEKINAKIEEMEKESYRLVTMSFWGTERAVLVFKKGLKGSLL